MRKDHDNKTIRSTICVCGYIYLCNYKIYFIEYKTVKIEPETLIKIYEKHAVLSEEIEKVLKEDKAIFKRVGGNQYIAIGLYDRYLTIFFNYNNKTKEATITTAYPSSKKQIKSYKKIVK